MGNTAQPALPAELAKTSFVWELKKDSQFGYRQFYTAITDTLIYHAVVSDDAIEDLYSEDGQTFETVDDLVQSFRLSVRQKHRMLNDQPQVGDLVARYAHPDANGVLYRLAKIHESGSIQLAELKMTGHYLYPDGVADASGTFMIGLPTLTTQDLIRTHLSRDAEFWMFKGDVVQPGNRQEITIRVRVWDLQK